MNNNEQKMHVQTVVADPTALGLFGLSMVTLVAATVKLGWTSGLAIVVPWAFFLGGLAQVIACMYDFKHNNLFGATVFGAYGLFWMSVAASWLITMGAFGPVLKAAASVPQLGWAFFGYFIFSLFGTVVATQTNKVIFTIMVLIDVLLLALALNSWGIASHLTHSVAAWSELTISALGFYSCGATFLNKFFGYVLLPLGNPLNIFNKKA